MFDIVVITHTECLVWCDTAHEQMAVIRDAIANGWDYEIPTNDSYLEITSIHRHFAKDWLAY